MAAPQRSLRNGVAGVAGRAIQFEDLKPEAQTKLKNDVGNLGSNMKQNVQKRISALGEKADAGKASPKDKVEQRTLQAIAPHVKNQRTTLTGATNRRVEAYGRGVQAAHERGETTPAGAGWYFEHHRDVAKSAKSFGVDKDRAIVASAVMSPQNSPENEKAAVHGLMDAMANHSVHMTSDLHSALSKRGVPVDRGQIGKTVPMNQLHPRALAELSSTTLRDSVQHTGANLHQISRGGTKENIAKAVDVLRGNVHPDEAIAPHNAPKIWSYSRNIRLSQPGSPEHVEYMSRVEHHAAVTTGRQHPGQQMADLYGLRHNDEGVLSSKAHTAEDTWMNSISHGQPNKTEGTGGRTSVMKTAGSHQQLSYVPNSAMQHAFNNKATRQAAGRLSQGHDFKMPAVAAQEVPWTHVRRETGKDPAWNAHQATAAKQPNHNLSGAQFGHQGELF